MKITLKAARVNAGMTQKEAADKIGVSETTIINWENGKTACNARMMPKIAALYNIPCENLIFFRPELRLNSKITDTANMNH